MFGYRVTLADRTITTRRMNGRVTVAAWVVSPGAISCLSLVVVADNPDDVLRAIKEAMK